VPGIDRIFVDADDGEFIVAQWKVLAATFVVTEKTDGKKLANALRKLVVRDNLALVRQIIALEAELSSLEFDIARQEDEMDAIVNGLYQLSNAEMVLVRKGMRSTSSICAQPATKAPSLGSGATECSQVRLSAAAVDRPVGYGQRVSACGTGLLLETDSIVTEGSVPKVQAKDDRLSGHGMRVI
jgi:hypothetical protein